MSELFGGMCRKPKLEVRAKEHRGITEVHGSAGVLLVLNGAGNPFFYGVVLSGGSTMRDGVGRGCGCVTIKGNLDCAERWNVKEIGGVAVSEIEPHGVYILNSECTLLELRADSDQSSSFIIIIIHHASCVMCHASCVMTCWRPSMCFSHSNRKI